MKRLLLAFACLSSLAFGAATIAPTSYSPPSLSYDDATNTPTQTFTIAGFSGTCTISILDNNNNVVTTDPQYGSLSSTSQACTTTTFTYNPPFVYPSGSSAQVKVTDGTLTAIATINFTPAFWTTNGCYLPEFYKRVNGRSFLFDSAFHVSSLYLKEPRAGATSVAAAARQLIAHCTLKGNTFEELIYWPYAGISGMLFPSTAGSQIDRPLFSFDGKYLFYQDTACAPGSFCTSSPASGSIRVLSSDGTGYTQLSGAAQGSTGSCTADYRRPHWLICTIASNSSFRVYNGDNAWAQTTIYTYNGGASCGSACLQFFEPPYPEDFSGNAKILVKTQNGANAACLPGCAPSVQIFDLSGVENNANGSGDPTTTLSAPAYNWSVNENLAVDSPQSGDGRVEQQNSALTCNENAGNAHCSVANWGAGNSEEFEVHGCDMFPDGQHVGCTYGPGGTAGESVSYKFNLDGTIAIPSWPRAFSNIPFYSHPSLSRANTTLIGYQGPQRCGNNLPATVGVGGTFDFNTSAGAGHACKYGASAAPEWVISTVNNQSINRCATTGISGNGATVTVTTAAGACPQPAAGAQFEVINSGTFPEGTLYTVASVTDSTHFTYSDSTNGTDNTGTPYIAWALASSELHDTWIEFDTSRFFLDLENGASPNHLQAVMVDNGPQHTPNQLVLIDFLRNSNGGTYNKTYGPSASPNGTSLGEAWPTGSEHGCNSAFQCSTQLGWFATPFKSPAPTRIALSGSAITWKPHQLNHETRDYWIWKQAGEAGAWAYLTQINADYVNTYMTQGSYSYTLSDLTAGNSACYAITSREWKGSMSDTTSKTICVKNTAGVYSVDSNGPEITNFDAAAPNAVTAMAVAQQILVAPVGAPALTTATSGGTVPDGTHWVKILYCNFTDFPANTHANVACSTPSSVTSIVTSGGGASTITVKNSGSASEVVNGGWAEVWSCANATDCSATTSTLQTCATINGVANSAQDFLIPYYNGDNLGRFTCVLTSEATGGTGVIAGGTGIQSYNITWTASSSSDARYNAIYSCDSTICPNARDLVTMQQYLIATVPASVTSWRDWLPNPSLTSTNVHYEVAVVNYQDKISAGVCVRGDGTSETCGP